MFRIDRQLVQVTQPAEIPLIPVDMPPLPQQEGSENLAQEVAATNLAAAEQAGSQARAMAQAQAQAQAETEALCQQLLQEAQEQAQLMLQDAEQQAALLLEEADRQARAIYDTARKEGYQDGHTEADEARQKQARQDQQQLQSLLKELAAAQEQFFVQAEQELALLSLGVAEKIVKTVIREPGPFEAMIKHALKQMRHESKITLRLSPQQYQDFFNSDSATFVLRDEEIHVSIITDSQLQPGDLILESMEESVKAGVDSQLHNIGLIFGRLALESGEDNPL